MKSIITLRSKVNEGNLISGEAYFGKKLDDCGIDGYIILGRYLDLHDKLNDVDKLTERIFYAPSKNLEELLIKL